MTLHPSSRVGWFRVTCGRSFSGQETARDIATLLSSAPLLSSPGLRRRTSTITSAVPTTPPVTRTPRCPSPLRVGWGDMRCEMHICSTGSLQTHPVFVARSAGKGCCSAKRISRDTLNDQRLFARCVGSIPRADWLVPSITWAKPSPTPLNKLSLLVIDSGRGSHVEAPRTRGTSLGGVPRQ